MVAAVELAVAVMVEVAVLLNVKATMLMVAKVAAGEIMAVRGMLGQ